MRLSCSTTSAVWYTPAAPGTLNRSNDVCIGQASSGAQRNGRKTVEPRTLTGTVVLMRREACTLH
eukprot:5649400-Amphidinium_carterae.1